MPERSTSTATPRLIIEPCTVASIHDGDTLHIAVPLHSFWPDISGVSTDVRVAHCNAAELGTPDGDAALAAVEAWLGVPARSPLRLLVYGRDKYGRLLADCETPAGELLSAFVLSLPGSVPMQLLTLDGAAVPGGLSTD